MRDMTARRFDRIAAGLGFTPSDAEWGVWADAAGNVVYGALRKWADGTLHVHHRKTLELMRQAIRPPQKSGADDVAAPSAPIG